MVVNASLERSAYYFHCAGSYVYLFQRVSDGVLEQVDEIGWAELSKPGERLGSRINRLEKKLLGDPDVKLASAWS